MYNIVQNFNTYFHRFLSYKIGELLKMKRLIFLILCLVASFGLFAQEIDSDYVFRASQKGDQYAKLNLSLNIPNKPEQLTFGGAGTLGYHVFLTDNFNLGGDVSFNYLKTIGNNVFYFIPFFLKAGYQFNTGKIEIPLYIGIGGAVQNYVDKSYFGLAIKPELGIYYRFSSEWSFGALAGLYILPQWFKNSDLNYTGFITDISASVRYHF